MKKKLAIGIFSFLSINSLLLAEESNLKIGNINFKNLYQLSEEYLSSKIPVKKGEQYNNKDLSDIYLSLKKLNYIANVSVIPKIEGETVDLIIEVDERANALEIAREIEALEQLKQKTNYLINDIQINGLNLIDSKVISTLIDVKIGEYLIPQKALDVAKKIFDTGYFSHVEPIMTRNEDNTVTIVYQVVENPIIKSIYINGNTLFSTEILEEALGIKKGEVLNQNLLNPETNGIVRAYHNEGYSLARIEEISLDSNEGKLEISLTEGIIKNVNFRKYETKTDNERTGESSNKLRTKQYVFDRVSKIKSGEIFKKENAEETMRELYRTGIFTAIEPVFYENQENTIEKDVEFLVEERPTASINGSISYGTEVGLIGGLKLSDSNFLGKAQEASLSAEISNDGDKTFEASIFNPWLKGTERIQAGGSIYWRESIDNNVNENEISKIKRLGTRWTLGKGLNSNIFIRGSVKFDDYSEYLKGDKISNQYKLLGITPSIVYDSRNNNYNPTKGIYATGTYEKGKLFSRKSLVGETGDQYDQIELDLRAYHTTFFKDKNVMAYRVVWGKTGSATPDSLRFSVGGSDSIRGYEGGSFDGFDKFHATIENRTQINSSLQFIAFFDIGNAWQTEVESETGYKIYQPNTKDATAFKDLKKGYGIGLRLETPMGPLRFDYGWPLDSVTKNGEKTEGKFYFNFGQAF